MTQGPAGICGAIRGSGGGRKGAVIGEGSYGVVGVAFGRAVKEPLFLNLLLEPVSIPPDLADKAPVDADAESRGEGAMAQMGSTGTVPSAGSAPTCFGGGVCIFSGICVKRGVLARPGGGTEAVAVDIDTLSLCTKAWGEVLCLKRAGAELVRVGVVFRGI